MHNSKLVLLFFLVCIVVRWHAECARWAHTALLGGPDYRLLWSLGPGPHEITFEVQVKTHGYVGFGLSRDGNMPGADFVVGWVENGQVYFQDRHVKHYPRSYTSATGASIGVDDDPLSGSGAANGAGGVSTLEVDSSQDYDLLLGYENETHTVLRFRRRLNTCDPRDIPITNDTMSALWIMRPEKPSSGSFAGKLTAPHHGSMRGSQSVYFLQRVNQEAPRVDEAPRVWELRNHEAKMPPPGDSLYWCRVFQMPSIPSKHHLIRYEPLLEDTGKIHLQHAILYECQESVEVVYYANRSGQMCRELGTPPLSCNVIVAMWARGSEGFTFPPEAGYPLEATSPKYYVLETHYSTPNDYEFNRDVTDSSGIRLYYTPELRRHDAGLLSIGIDPNWRHIIPPGQPRVISSGHCIAECTKQAFPETGINIFAVVTRTHKIGKQIRLRQIRDSTELPLVFEDDNLNSEYQEYRRLNIPVRVLPGDHLIAECSYNSSQRSAITLGGLTDREETCIVTSLYYPLQKKLTTCHSLPSLPTVLNSLGIQELQTGSNPLRISAPPELAGMTLETRLLTYDWRHHFPEFQLATQRGSFRPRCWNANFNLLPGTENMESHFPNITHTYERDRNANTCPPSDDDDPHGTSEVRERPPTLLDDNQIEMTSRNNKVSRSPGEHTLGLSSAPSSFQSNSSLTQTLICLLLVTFVLVRW